MQFYGKLTSNQSIGRETLKFYGKLTSKVLTKVLERKLRSFCEEINLPKYWKGNHAVFMGN